MQFKKIFKVILIGSAGIISVALVALALVVTVINPNHFKPLLTTAVYQATGRTLSLAGDISWKVYPNLGLNLKQVSLSNPAGFKMEQMLQINSLEVAVALLPLLRQQVIIKTLAIDGLKLDLATQGGRNNWTFNPPRPAAPSLAAPSTPQPLQLELSALSLTNSNFSYDNPALQQHRALSKVNLQLTSGFGGGIRYNAGAGMLDIAKVNFNFFNELKGKLNLKVTNLAAPSYVGDIAIATFSLKRLLAQLALPQLALPAVVNPRLLDHVGLVSAFSSTAQHLSLTNLKLKIANTSISGQLKLSSFKPVIFSENLYIDQLDIADYSQVNGFRIPLRNLQLSGNSSIGSMNSLNGQQTLHIQNVSVLGLDLAKLVGQLDRSLSSGSSSDIVHTLVNSAQVVAAVKHMQATVAAAAVVAVRDLSQKTNLGAFTATLHAGRTNNASSFNLTGPSLALTGTGTVNLWTQTLNYKVNSQLLVAGINPLFKQLIFPATLQGSFKQPTATLDWAAIEPQILHLVFAANKPQLKAAISQQLNQVLSNALGTNAQPLNHVVDSISNAATNLLGNIFAK